MNNNQTAEEVIDLTGIIIKHNGKRYKVIQFNEEFKVGDMYLDDDNTIQEIGRFDVEVNDKWLVEQL